MNIRGHHLFCTYCFYGSGKKRAEDFFGVENAIPELLEKLRQNPHMEISVQTDLDDVCEICPLKRPDGCGRSADAAAQNEKEHMQGLGISPESAPNTSAAAQGLESLSMPATRMYGLNIKFVF